MFRRFAALVKLRSSATARNADKTLSSSRTIVHSQSTALADCTATQGSRSQATLNSQNDMIGSPANSSGACIVESLRIEMPEREVMQATVSVWRA